MLQAPTLLSDAHDLAPFMSGYDTLDEWLRRRARANQFTGASRTYVVADARRVVAYYCLSSGGLAASDAPGALRRNMPDPIPVTILGRLAVDRDWQGRGLGTALVQDAVLRTSQAAAIVGIRGLIAHAISDGAKAFYEHYGFVASQNNPMTLILSIRR